MSEAELIKENESLKAKIKYLENIINRGNAGNSNAYNAIRGMIINKVAENVPLDEEDFRGKDWKRKRAERNLMADLKWEIHVRRTSDFRVEHIKQAEEFINNYTFEKEV